MSQILDIFKCSHCKNVWRGEIVDGRPARFDHSLKAYHTGGVCPCGAGSEAFQRVYSEEEPV
jgi:hypothetical protein